MDAIKVLGKGGKRKKPCNIPAKVWVQLKREEKITGPSTGEEKGKSWEG